MDGWMEREKRDGLLQKILNCILFLFETMTTTKLANYRSYIYTGRSPQSLKLLGSGGGERAKTASKGQSPETRKSESSQKVQSAEADSISEKRSRMGNRRGNLGIWVSGISQGRLNNQRSSGREKWGFRTHDGIKRWR